MPTSIWSRKRDLIYLIFFLTHIPIMLVVDLARYYPTSLRPHFTLTIRDFYIRTTHDRFFIPTSPTPPWLHLFLALEAIFHLPLSIWAVSALWRDAPLVPLWLLLWSVETALTTGVCIVDVGWWEGYTGEERRGLYGVYGPYLGIACLMGIDMFIRVRRQLLRYEGVKDKDA